MCVFILLQNVVLNIVHVYQIMVVSGYGEKVESRTNTEEPCSLKSKQSVAQIVK